jgi:SAM-dependent methyltransferase
MSKPHDNSAKYYDFVMERRFGVLYNKLTQDNLSKIKSIALNGKILDFGAGTGRISIPLAMDGYYVTAIDCSSQMLEELKRKAQSRNLNIDTHLTLTDLNKTNFDFAIAIFTVLAYVKVQCQLKAIFEIVFSSLKPGGYFMFDLERRSGYDIILRINNGIIHNSPEDFVKVNFEDNNSNLFKYFENVKGTLPCGEAFNYTESFEIKFWTIEEVRIIFNEIGFVEIEKFSFANADYILLKKS